MESRISGGSIEDAVIIIADCTSIGIDFEYRYIENILGPEGNFWQIDFQEIIFNDDEIPYDKMTVLMKDGTSRDFFFNIESFFGKI